MKVRQINEECYQLYDEDYVELFITRHDNKWLIHNLLSSQEEPHRLIKFFKQAISWIDENIEEELYANIKDTRMLRMLNKFGFGISSIEIVRRNNEKRNEKK